MCPRVSSNKGIALLIVVSVLTVIAVIGVSFVFSMFLETQASAQFSSTVQARYLAEAGMHHAWALLEEDRLGSRVDDLTEGWTAQMQGSESDVDGAGGPESRWWMVADSAHHSAGRYGVLISDEAGKLNLNTALAVPPTGVDALNLTTLLQRAGVANAADVAKAIEAYRYGPDSQPGAAGVDDDRDGTVDEPDEYQPLALRGDDRRFERLEELLGVGGLREPDLAKLRPYATTYSWDPNISVTGQLRLNVNTATAEVLLGALLQTGVNDPWQMAANMADYADSDLAMSRVNKIAASYDVPAPSVLSQAGHPPDGWTWQPGSPNHYTSDQAGASLVWTVTDIPSGTFLVRVRGQKGKNVGDVTINGQTKRSLNSGDAFGEMALGGSLMIEVARREPVGTICAFAGVELVAKGGVQGVTPVSVRGIEAIRINEVMVAPRIELTVSQVLPDDFDKPTGSAWTCPDPADPTLCSNTGSGSASWTWRNSNVPAGHYYVDVYGKGAGTRVGPVAFAGGMNPSLLHGERHSSTLTVSDDHRVTITINKDQDSPACYLQNIVLSLEPDAEYVELINLSDADIDVSGWSLGGPATNEVTAIFPTGSIIAAHQVLAGAVDVDDRLPAAHNQISARSAWAIPTTVAVAQLQFQGGAPPERDWLLAAPPAGRGELILKTANGDVADEVQYTRSLPTPAPFQSLEKGDPTVIVDTDQDGIDDGWFASNLRYTPGAENYNEGTIEVKDAEHVITHHPSPAPPLVAEVSVLNRSLRSVGELAGLPGGTAWHAVSSEELANIVDRLTVQGLRLEAAAATQVNGGAWDQTANGYSTSHGHSGTWRWTSVPDGTYLLTIYAEPGEQVSVRWPGGDWSTPPSADAQGRIPVGQVVVSGTTVTVELRCESAGCHLNALALDPQMVLIGLVNVNTASTAVLLSLPGVTEAVAGRLVSARPYGEQGGATRGIGDLLLGVALGVDESDKLARFRQLAHLVTVRSSMFQIISVGEALEHGHPTASQRITAVIQR